MAYVDQTRGLYRVRVRLPDRTTITDSTHLDRQDAEDRAAEIGIAQRRRKYRDPRLGRITLAEWVQIWAKTHHVAPTTWQGYQGFLKRHILPQLGHLPLTDIDRPTIKTFLAYLRAKMSDKSAANIMKVLSLILNEAVAEERLDRNPCKLVRWNAEQEERPHASAQQVLDIAAHIPSWTNKVMVITAAYTGMRWGELAGLHRDHVHLQDGFLHIPKEDGALKEINYQLVKGPPKTPASRGRDIALPPFLVELLALVLAGHNHAHVFAGARAPLQRRNTFGKTWRNALAVATLPASHRSLRDMHFHDLRHTHKTWMIEDNIPEIAQCDRLGHKLGGVRGIYSHTTPQMIKQLVHALQRRWLRCGGPRFTETIKAQAARGRRITWIRAH